MAEDELTVSELKVEQKYVEKGKPFVHVPNRPGPVFLPPSIREMEDRVSNARRALRDDLVPKDLKEKYRKMQQDYQPLLNKWNIARDQLKEVFSIGKLAWLEDGGKEEAVLTTVLEGMHDIDHAIKILNTLVEVNSPKQCLAVVRIMEVALCAYGLGTVSDDCMYSHSDCLKWADDFLEVMKLVDRKIPGLLRKRALNPNNTINPFQGIDKDLNDLRAARMPTLLISSAAPTHARDQGRCQLTTETAGGTTVAHILPYRVTNLGSFSVPFLLVLSLIEPQEVSCEIYKLCFGSRCCSPANMITIARDLENKFMNNCYMTMEALPWRDGTAKLVEPFVEPIKKYEEYTDKNGYILHVHLRSPAGEDPAITVPCRHNPTPSPNSNHQLPERLTPSAISAFKETGKPLSWQPHEYVSMKVQHTTLTPRPHPLVLQISKRWVETFNAYRHWRGDTHLKRNPKQGEFLVPGLTLDATRINRILGDGELKRIDRGRAKHKADRHEASDAPLTPVHRMSKEELIELSNTLYKNQAEVMDGGNPYGLDDLDDFDNDALNDFYISNSSSNGSSSTESNNSTAPTVKSEAISVDCMIFPADEGYAREAGVDSVSDSNCIGQLKHH